MSNPNWKKGVSGNPKGKPKGILNKETLTKLERRAYFEKRAQEKFDEWIDKVKPEYGLDQFLGKSPEKHEVVVENKESLPLEKIEEIDKIAFEDDK